MNKATNISDTNLFLYVSVILFSLSLFSFSVLSSISSIATSEPVDFVDNVDITVPVSCRLEGTVNSAHSATIPNGIYSVNYTAEGGATPYSNGIGQTTLTAYCNDNNGFAISAIGYSNNEYGNTNLIGTNTNTLIATGTATSGDTSNWAMKLAKVAGTYEPIIVGTTEDTEKEQSTPNYSTYQAVPSTYTRVAYKNSATDMGANPTGSSLTTTYAAYISRTQPADTYAGQVKYTLTHPASARPVIPLANSDCPANSICYAPNASDIVGTMVSTTDAPTLVAISASPIAGRQTQAWDDIDVDSEPDDITSNFIVDLIAPNYSRARYGFAGWSTDFEADENSVIYGPNESINVGNVSNNGKILYPVWVESAGTLQSDSNTVCDNLVQASANATNTLASVSALTDERDGQTYAIAKLSDGKCWMIENLRLNAEYTRDSMYESLSQGYGESVAYGNFIGLADSENVNFFSVGSNANSLYSTNGSTAINIGSGDSAFTRMPRYNNSNINRALNVSYNGTGQSSDSLFYSWYSYGNYYTWAAAMANTTPMNNATSSESSGTSICPYGWHLPTSGSSAKEFNILYDSLGTSKVSNLRKYPNNFVYAGAYMFESPGYRGYDGYYWSSSGYSVGASRMLYFYSNEAYPNFYGDDAIGKFTGASVRCVMSDTVNPGI